MIEGGEPAMNMLKELIKPNFFERGIEYFGPGQERFSAFTDMTEDFNLKVAAIFEVWMRYESGTGKRYEETAVIDMAEWKGAQQLGTPSIYKIANSLERLQRDVNHFASDFLRLGINVHTQSDRENNELRQRHTSTQRPLGQSQEPPPRPQEIAEQPDSGDEAP